GGAQVAGDHGLPTAVLHQHAVGVAAFGGEHVRVGEDHHGRGTAGHAGHFLPGQSVIGTLQHQAPRVGADVGAVHHHHFPRPGHGGGADVVPLGHGRDERGAAGLVGERDLAGPAHGLEHIAVCAARLHAGLQVLVHGGGKRGHGDQRIPGIHLPVQYIVVHGPSAVIGTFHQDGARAPVVAGGEVYGGV